MKLNSKLLKQLILFGLVGGGSLLIDLAVTTTVYNELNVSAGLAGCVGFVSAFFFNFPINRRHVFKHTKLDKYSLRMQVVLYCSLSLFNLAATAILMQLLVNSLSVQVSLAKAGVTAIIAFWNFLIFKFVIFTKRPNTAELDSLIFQ